MILYTLDTKINLKKQRKIYLCITLFVLLFSIIYEEFSHNVYTIFMYGAFLIPLIFGIVMSFVFMKYQSIKSNKIYNAAVYTLTIASILEGVVKIYGTTNSKIYIFLIASIILFILSFAKFKEKND